MPTDALGDRQALVDHIDGRGYGDVTGLIKPNPRFVEAGTVFSFAQGGQQSVLGLQKPVSITGLKVTPDPGMKSLDQGFMGLGFGAVRSARGGGGIGALLRGAGVDKSEADFWVNVDAAEFQPALVGAGSTIFKELAQIMAGAK